MAKRRVRDEAPQNMGRSAACRIQLAVTTMDRKGRTSSARAFERARFRRRALQMIWILKRAACDGESNGRLDFVAATAAMTRYQGAPGIGGTHLDQPFSAIYGYFYAIVAVRDP